MRRKLLYILIALLLLVIIPLNSRSLFDVGLKVVTLYDADTGIETSGFFPGMRDGANWNFGFGLDGRISILHASVLATSVFGDENLMDLYYSAMIDIPIVNEVVYLSLGGGLSNQLYLSEDDGEEIRSSTRSTGDSFGEIMIDSPIHLKASVDVILGPAVLSVFYLRETNGKIGDSLGDIFTSGGENKGGVALTLMLF